jgi:hypothetical protein
MSIVSSGATRLPEIEIEVSGIAAKAFAGHIVDDVEDVEAPAKGELKGGTLLDIALRSTLSADA